MYDIIREGDGLPLEEHDFRAWQEAKELNPELARRIAEDALTTHIAVRRGLVSEVDGLPMPLISDISPKPPEY